MIGKHDLKVRKSPKLFYYKNGAFVFENEFDKTEKFILIHNEMMGFRVLKTYMD